MLVKLLCASFFAASLTASADIVDGKNGMYFSGTPIMNVSFCVKAGNVMEEQAAMNTCNQALQANSSNLSGAGYIILLTNWCQMRETPCPVTGDDTSPIAPGDEGRRFYGSVYFLSR